MSAPVFIVPVQHVANVSAGDVVTIDGDEGSHGVSAKRLRVGESVEVVDGAGRRVVGIVDSVDRSAFTVRAVLVRDEPQPTPTLIAVQALAKGARSDLAVEMLTECGVDQIVPWSATNSVSVWKGDRADSGARRWAAVAVAATKQSCRARVPVITDLASSDDVADLLANSALGLVLHESATARLSKMAIPTTGTVVVVVGPEGGINDQELLLFGEAGALAVRMGESVLRTSTAGVAAAAVIMANAGRWN